MRSNINGIILLDKPQHITSNGALQRVKRLFNAKKVGHTGSLDPIATGMLPLCFGEATKFSQFLLDSDKVYEVTARLGEQTTTGDSEGEVNKTLPFDQITAEKIRATMLKFDGMIEQVPPMFSAIKHQGKPLYELARRGIEVTRQPRSVRIFSITLHECKQNEFSFSVHCSKGTYVRTLVEDICQAMDTCGHVIGLRRTSVTPYADAVMYSLPTLEAIAERSGAEGLLACLLPVETAVQVYPAVQLSASAAFYLRMGQPVRASFPIDSPLVRLMSEDARFLGVGEVMADGRVKPQRLVAAA